MRAEAPVWVPSTGAASNRQPAVGRNASAATRRGVSRSSSCRLRLTILSAPTLERRPTLETDPGPTFKLTVVQRLGFAAASQDQHSGTDQLMTNVCYRTRGSELSDSSPS